METPATLGYVSTWLKTGEELTYKYPTTKMAERRILWLCDVWSFQIRGSGRTSSATSVRKLGIAEKTE